MRRGRCGGVQCNDTTGDYGLQRYDGGRYNGGLQRGTTTTGDRLQRGTDPGPRNAPHDQRPGARPGTARLSQSYNTRHERTGTLWEGRFGSLLADKSIEALGATAAYIDLNAVRAGLVQDPVDYRWSGYAEAVAGSRQAREGLGMVMLSRGQSPDWDRAAGKYRRLLYTTGQAKGVSETGGALKPGFSPEDVKRVLEAGGKLPLNVVLRCRVRYFTAGLVLGTRAYVEHIQHRHAAQICSARGTGPSAMIGCDWGDLFVNHQLKGDLITVPGC